MAFSLPIPRISGPGAVRGAAMVALAAGVGVWGAILLAPAPSEMPPMLLAAPTEGFSTTLVSQWFGGGNMRVKVTVVGLISAGQRGAALLSVNGAAPQAYRVGQQLAPGILLAGVAQDAVSIDQDGVIEQVAVPQNPADLVRGFVPVPPTAPPQGG